MRQQHVTLVPHAIKRFSRRLFGNLLHTAARVGSPVWEAASAILLADALGVQIDQAEFGGLHQIASGEQTGETVRRMMESLRCRPFFGSGWKVLVVNEADAMTPNAAFVWLDALEDLPPQTVVIFTTNAAGRIPARLRDRCERLAFESSALLLRPYRQELTDRIWREEGCASTPPEVETLGVADENGNPSFRRLVQKLTPYIRAGAAAAAPKSIAAEPEDRLHVFGRRWAGGERITQMAREAGTFWNRLWSELTALGDKKGA
jgi:hypothetical protein